MRERFRSTVYKVPQISNDRFRHVVPDLESDIGNLASLSKKKRMELFATDVKKLAESRDKFFPARDWILENMPKKPKDVTSEAWVNTSQYQSWKKVWNAGLWRANKLEELSKPENTTGIKKRWAEGVKSKIGVDEKEIRQEWEKRYGVTNEANRLWEDSGHIADYIMGMEGITSASEGIAKGKILDGIGLENMERENAVRAYLKSKGVSSDVIENSIRMTKIVQTRSGLPEKPPIKGGMVAEYSGLLRRVFGYESREATASVAPKPEHAKK